MAGARAKVFELDVGGYHCRVRALSLREYLPISEGALLFPTGEQKEEILLNCILEPKELRESIECGDIPAGIPLLIFDYIMEFSGYGMTVDERNSVLDNMRSELELDVISSCKTMIVASGLKNLNELDEYSLMELLELVVLAEQVLNIQQSNIMAAFAGGEMVKISWETPLNKHEELMRKMQQKQQEVQQLLEQQTSPRGGMGVRRM